MVAARSWPFGTGPPIDTAREQAADAARAELEKYIYTREEPGVIWRTISWLRERFAELIGTIGEAIPVGRWALFILPILVLLAVVIIRWRVGAVAATRSADARAVFAGTNRTAAEHRTAADAAAARRDYATACRERFRAVVRDLEERTILDPRPGRTADETAAEVAALSDAAGPAVSAAARAFDEVLYGGRTATAETDALMKAADTAARGLRASAMAP